MADTPDINYSKSTTTLKSAPKAGENINLFLRPGDELSLGVDISKAKLQIVGGDVIATLPSGGQITFVSLGMMAFEANAPIIKLPGGSIIQVEQILNKIQDIGQAPQSSILVSGPVSFPEEPQKNTPHDQQTNKEEAPVNNYNAFYVDPQPFVKPAEDTGKNNNSGKYLQEAVANLTSNNLGMSDETRKASSDESKTQSSRGVADVSAALSYDIGFYQIEGAKSASTYDGGTGSIAGNTSKANSAQFEAETIDYRSDTSVTTIVADNPSLVSETYITKLVRLTISQPVGFEISSINILGLSNGFEILTKNYTSATATSGGWSLSSTEFSSTQSSGGEVIEFYIRYSPNSTNLTLLNDYLMRFKVTSQFSETLASQIEATTGTDITTPELKTLTTVSDVGVIVKNVTTASEYTYNGQYSTGFVLSSTPNTNIIYTSTASSVVGGGISTDTIIGSIGNDTLRGYKGNDTISGGTGTNIIDGGYNQTVQGSYSSTLTTADDGSDTVSYAFVSKYSQTFLDNVSTAYKNALIAYVAAGHSASTFDADLLAAYHSSPSTSFYGVVVKTLIDPETGSVYANDSMGVSVDLATGIGTGSSVVNATTTEIASGSNAEITKTISDTLISIENIIGSSYNDTLRGDSNTNTILGGEGDDTLDGRSGSDILDGGAGNDWLVGDIYDTRIDGGAGTDTADFSSVAQAINATLTTGADGTIVSGGLSLKIQNVENLMGTTFADTIIGGSADNVLIGGFNQSGNVSDDTLDGGAGNDTLYGDMLFTVNSTVTTFDATLGGTLDAYIGGNDIIKGGDGDDILYGDVNYSVVASLVSNITMTTAADQSVDYLIATPSGNTLAIIRGGNDTLMGGLGDDKMDGGSGYDTVDYSSSNAGVTVNLLSGIATGQGVDTLKNIENIIGSNYSDTLTGNTLNNTLDGGTGSDWVNYANATQGVIVDIGSSTAISGTATIGTDTDTLKSIENVIGSDFNDTFYGYFAHNTFKGGAGTDAIDYGNFNASINVTLGSTTSSTDILIDIENVYGTSNNDVIVGDDNGNTLDGRDGNDTLIGGRGNDLLIGGNGSDLVDYSTSVNGIIVDLANSTVTNDGLGGRDTLSSIENVIGSAQNDIITGSVSNNTLIGGSGSDTFYGSSGSDIYYGSDTLNSTTENDILDYTTAVGVNHLYVDVNAKSITKYSDTLNLTLNGIDTYSSIEQMLGTSGNDTFKISSSSSLQTLTGNGGSDFLDFSSATNGIRLDLSLSSAQATNGVGTLTLNDAFENVSGSNMGADTISGNSENNTLWGNGGNDTLFGMQGSDILYGGAGNDILYADTTIGGTFSDTVTDTNTLYGDDGNDTLYGSMRADTLYGGNNNDMFVAISSNDGSDYIDGGSGIDTVDYSRLSSNITVALTDAIPTIVTIAGGTNDTLVNVENFMAGSGDDTITGSSGINSISGGAGNDLFYFAKDNLTSADTIDGGSGNNTLAFTDGGTFNDNSQFTNVLNVSKIQFADVANTIQLDLNSITLVGGTLSDTFSYALANFSASDIIDGNAGNDTLSFTTSGTLTSSMLNSISHIETIQLSSAGANNVTVDVSSVTNTMLGGTLADTFSYSLSQLSSADIIDAGSGIDKLVFLDAGTVNNDAIFNGLSNFEQIQLANGVNTFTIGSANEAKLSGLSIMGGTGVDTFIYDSAILNDTTANALLIGASANDTLKLTGSSTVIDSNMAGFSGIGTLDLNAYSGSITLGTNANTMGIATINASSNTSTMSVNASAMSNALIINSGSGNDTLIGGSGIDTFNIISSKATLVGNGSNDILNINAVITQDASKIATIETININANTTLSNDISGVSTLNITSGKSLNLDASAINGDTMSLVDSGTLVVNNASTLDFSHLSFSGAGSLQVNGSTANDTLSLSGITLSSLSSVTLSGGNGDDLLTGSSRADTLLGGIGNDTLIGGAGGDYLDGGADNDVYKYTSASDIVSDTINDASGTDTILLASAETYNFSTGAVSLTGVEVLDFGSSTNVTLSTTQTGSLSTLMGTSGVDTLSLTGSSIDLSGKTLSAIETLALGTVTNSTLSAAQALSSTSLTTISGTGGLSVTGNLTSALNLSSTGKNFSGNVTIANANGNNVTLGGGNDSITNSTGGGTLYGGSGNDTYNISAATTISDSAGTSDVLNITGSFTQDASNITGVETININANTTLTGTISAASVVVASGKTLTAAASVVSGKAISGSGTVAVSDLDGTPAANLSTLTATTVNATWDGNATYTGNLGNANLTVASGTMTLGTGGVVSGSGTVTVASGATLSLGAISGLGSGTNTVSGTLNADASLLSGVTVGGTGTININNLQNSLSANFASLASGATVNATWASGTATYAGNLTNVDTLVLSSGTMSIKDSILGITAVNGAGNLIVNANDSSMNLLNVNITGTLTVNDGLDAQTLTGSYNSDTFNITHINDIIRADSGNDTINITSASSTFLGDIDGGNGTDTLNINSNVTLDMSKTGSIEIFNVNNSATFANGTLNGATINLAAGTTFNASTTTLNAVVINGNSGNETVTLNQMVASSIDLKSGSDTYNIAVATNISDSGSSGTDILNILSGGTVNYSGTGATFSGIETINNSGTLTLDYSDIGTTSILGSGNLTITGNDTATLSLSSYTGNVYVTDANSYNVTLGSGNDTIYDNVVGGSTNTLAGGSGNDTYFVSEAINIVESTSGGTADTVVLQHDIDFTGKTLANIEALNLGTYNATITSTQDNSFALSGTGTLTINSSGGTYDASNITGHGVTINGVVGTDAITGTGYADTIFGNGGADTINAGAGADKFVLDFSNVSSLVSFNGGADSDTVQLNNLSSGTLDMSKFSNIETLDISTQTTSSLSMSASSLYNSADTSSHSLTMNINDSSSTLVSGDSISLSNVSTVTSGGSAASGLDSINHTWALSTIGDYTITTTDSHTLYLHVV